MCVNTSSLVVQQFRVIYCKRSPSLSTWISIFRICAGCVAFSTSTYVESCVIWGLLDMIVHFWCLINFLYRSFSLEIVSGNHFSFVAQFPSKISVCVVFDIVQMSLPKRTNCRRRWERVGMRERNRSLKALPYAIWDWICWSAMPIHQNIISTHSFVDIFVMECLDGIFKIPIISCCHNFLIAQYKLKIWNKR